MNFSDDRGSAVLEFIGFGVLVQVLILLAVLQLSQSQHEKLAAEAVARHSLRSFVLVGTPPEQTATEVIAGFKINLVPQLKLTCKPNCEVVGAIVGIDVSLGQAKARAVMVR